MTFSMKLRGKPPGQSEEQRDELRCLKENEQGEPTRERDGFWAALQAWLGVSPGVPWEPGRHRYCRAQELTGEAEESPLCWASEPYRHRRKGRVSLAEGTKEVEAQGQNSLI